MGVVYNTLKDKKSEVAVLRRALELYPNESSIASNIAEASCMYVCNYVWICLLLSILELCFYLSTLNANMIIYWKTHLSLFI